MIPFLAMLILLQQNNRNGAGALPIIMFVLVMAMCSRRRQRNSGHELTPAQYAFDEKIRMVAVTLFILFWFTAAFISYFGFFR